MSTIYTNIKRSIFKMDPMQLYGLRNLQTTPICEQESTLVTFDTTSTFREEAERGRIFCRRMSWGLHRDGVLFPLDYRVSLRPDY